MAQIFSLFGSIFIDNEKANKSIDDTTKKGKNASKSFGESFLEVSKTAMKIGSAVATTTVAVGTAMLAAANKTSETADTIDKASSRMNISYKSYQELAYAAGQCGVEMSAMEKAAKKLEGTDLNMEDAMQQIMALGTAQERARKASELFGDNIAYTLSPLIEQSTDDYEGLIKRANELGLVMGDDAVKAGVAFGDTLSDVKQSFGALANQAISAIIPIISKFLNLIIDNLPTIQAMFDRITPLLVKLAETVFPVLVDLVGIILPPLLDLLDLLMPILVEIIEEIMPIFNEILQTLLPPLIEIVKALLPPLMEILEALMPILKPIIELLLEIIRVIMPPIITIIKNVANIISNVLGTALKGLKPIVEGVKTVFSNVFNAIVNIVKTPINFIISGINTFIKGLNKIKIPDWVPAIGGKGINLPLISKLRVGLEYVPYDEMPALLHKGEQVLTKEEAELYRKQQQQPLESQQNYVYNNTINIDHLEVREKDDIERIARELYYLQKKAEV